MSEPVTRQRPSVDLDDFERRMHSAPGGHGAHEDDPLAELARIVGNQRDPYEDVFAQEAVAHAAHDRGAYHQDTQDQGSHGYDGHHEPAFEQATPSPRFPSDFAAIEAGLRGAISPDADHDAYPVEHSQYAAEDDQPYAYRPEHAVAPRSSASRRPIYLMAATIAVGVLGVGGAFALKGHGTSPSDVKTIMAAAGPTKVQPPAPATDDQGAQDSALLGKGNQATPTKLVSNTEEPVDVGQAVQENAAARGTTDASSVPVPPSPGQADGSVTASVDPAPAPTPATDFAMGMPAPKRVKVVSVRPDGTILSDDQPAAAAVTSDTQVRPSGDSHPAPVAKASAAKAAPAKTVSRVVPKRVADAPVADGPDASETPAPTKSAKKAKPQKMAMAEPADTASPANDSQAAANTSGGGGFAVQLAAPGSEADARAASSKFAKKYADALGGRHLGFHKAQSNGKSVYRVRVSSLSKDEAQSLCEKLKANGGSCFVAKN